MLVTFKNTGMIEEADIRLDGLTVIAGENDTGKSTVGKLMYSIIKTFNRYEKDARLYQVRSIQQLIEQYYFDFRKKYSDSPVLEAGRTFFNQLQDEALGLIDKSRSIVEIQANISDKVNSFIDTVQRLSDVEISLVDIPETIAPLIVNKPKKEEVHKLTLRNYIFSLFSDDIVNKYAKTQKFSIIGKEEKHQVFRVTGTSDSLGVDLNDKLYFEDATFIESPIVLNLVDTLRFSKTLFDKDGDSKKQAELLEKPYAPEYMKDLILKLTDRPTRGKSSGIGDQIRDIIDGDFYYDPGERDFVFEKGNRTFKGLSIAPGIKYMGIVNILTQADFLNKKSLLVLDEPETHLHPQWQVRFAEVLVKLVKEGKNILLTSHSPYLIEAVKLYADHYLESKEAAFYLSQKKKNAYISYILNVTHDISPIFEILAKPFDKLELLQLKDTA